jgi:hypothetical protein
MTSAPVAIFAFRRPEHTQRLIESLRANPETDGTEFVAFCDGPRTERDRPFVDATRAVLRRSGLPRLELVERERNLGLAASVIDGVTRLCQAHGRVIVLEDDLVVSPTFLGFMNGALEAYADEKQVFQVSGFMFPVELPTAAAALFLPFTNSWGWATWDRAWRHFDHGAAAYWQLARDGALRRRFDLGGRYYFFEMLRRQVRGEIDSWAIRWYLSVFMRDGLTIFPRRSLVENAGFGGDATHCVGDLPAHAAAAAAQHRVEAFPSVRVDPAHLDAVSAAMGRDYRFHSRVANTVRRLLYPTPPKQRP